MIDWFRALAKDAIEYVPYVITMFLSATLSNWLFYRNQPRLDNHVGLFGGRVHVCCDCIIFETIIRREGRTGWNSPRHHPPSQKERGTVSQCHLELQPESSILSLRGRGRLRGELSFLVILVCVYLSNSATYQMISTQRINKFLSEPHGLLAVLWILRDKDAVVSTH